MMIYKVRYAAIEDTQGWLSLVELVRDSFPGLDILEYTDIMHRKMADKEALAATDGTRITGVMLFSRASGEIEFLAVHPDCRRQGIAQALVAEMIRLLPSGTKVTVTTYREGDALGTVARRFYESLGFKPGALITIFDYPCQVLQLKAEGRNSQR